MHVHFLYYYVYNSCIHYGGLPSYRWKMWNPHRLVVRGLLSCLHGIRHDADMDCSFRLVPSHTAVYSCDPARCSMSLSVLFNGLEHLWVQLEQLAIKQLQHGWGWPRMVQFDGVPSRHWCLMHMRSCHFYLHNSRFNHRSPQHEQRGRWSIRPFQ